MQYDSRRARSGNVPQHNPFGRLRESGYLVAMNRYTWNGLAQDDKEAIRRAAEISYQSLGRVMDSSYDAMLEDLKSAGAKVRLLDGAELDAWNKTTKFQQIQAKWILEQEVKGVKDAGPVMEKVRNLLNEAMH